MPRTDERGGSRTRARIAGAAAGLFLERGFDAVTVAEVARQAGVSSVTVFKHYPRKEDLFLDRQPEAEQFLRAAVRDRDPGVDVLTSLRDLTFRLVEERHPLSGVGDRSVPWLRTVVGSAALVARAREIAADLQRGLAEELERDGSVDDGTLLAALFVAGYSTVMVRTARRLLAGASPAEVVDDHRARFEELFDMLRHGVSRPTLTADRSPRPAGGAPAASPSAGPPSPGRAARTRARPAPR